MISVNLLLTKVITYQFPGINDSLFSFVEHVLLTGSAPVNPHGFPTQSPFASQERDLKHSAVNSTYKCGISVSNTLIFLPYALLTVAVISLEMLVRGITIVIKIPSIRSFGLICRLTIDTERSKSSRPLAER